MALEEWLRVTMSRSIQVWLLRQVFTRYYTSGLPPKPHDSLYIVRSLFLLISTKAVITGKPSYCFIISGVLVLILGTHIDFLGGRFTEMVVRFILFPNQLCILLVFEITALRIAVSLQSRLFRYMNMVHVERNKFKVESKTILCYIC